MLQKQDGESFVFCTNKLIMSATSDDIVLQKQDGESFVAWPEYKSLNPTFVCTQQVLQVTPSPHDQRCNLFQTKADVGNGKACKVIIDGGSCRNLASTELCTKLNLEYYPHPSPYCISWLSDVGEMKVTNMVRVKFSIGSYTDTVECDVVPMSVCHLLLG